MGKCDNCRLRKESAKAFDIHWHGEDDCPYDKCPVPDFPKTHADRIRAKSVEELAEFLAQQEYRKPVFDGWLPLCYHVMGPRRCNENGCEKCWLDWLKQEVEE